MTIHYEIRDCLEGMSELEDQSIHLCFTDPPYDEFNVEWFNEVLRICKGIIFSPGKQHYFDWIRYKKPDYQSKYWYKVNTQGTDLIEPFLCYGSIKNISKLRCVFEFPFRQMHKRIGKHPYPKNANMCYYVLFKLKPHSVLDPFLGSGTTAMVCKQLGINFIGFEINKKYEKEINDNLKYTKKQLTLFQKTDNFSETPSKDTTEGEL